MFFARLSCALLILFISAPAYCAHDTMINPFGAAGANTGYPQTPSKDDKVTIGDYLIRFSTFQYFSGEEHFIKSVAFIKNRKTKKAYTGPLTMVFKEKILLGEDDKPVSRKFEEAFEKRYINYGNLDYDTTFDVKISFDADGKEIATVFELVIGEPGPNFVAIGSAVLLLACFVGFIYIKKRSAPTFTPAG